MRQINTLIKAINRNGENLVGVYAESDQSGMMLNRPEFRRLMNDAKKGRFAKLYLRDMERISRDSKQLQLACKQLGKNGVAIISGNNSEG